MCLQDWVWWVIECKGLEIRPIRSFLPECNARYPSEGIKGTVPSFLPFPSVIRTRQHVNLGADIGEHIKNTSASSGVTESSAISPMCN